MNLPTKFIGFNVTSFFIKKFYIVIIVNNNMKRVIGVFIVISLLLGAGFFVNATVDKTKQWHSGNSIIVEIDGFNVTLQEVIDNYYLGPAFPTHSSVIPNYGHFASQVIIATQNGHIMTLQEAVNHEAFGGSMENYTTELLGGHLANEIEVSISGNLMTLQEAIDSGNLAGNGCVSNVGASCGATSCVNAGTINCDGNCIGKTNKAAGTSCGTNKECSNGICMDTACTPGDTRTAECPRRPRQVVVSGSAALTCQADGTWLRTVGTCIYRASSSGGGGGGHAR